MKNKFLLIIFTFISGTFLYAQSLNEAILTAAIRISNDLPANSTAAVVSFTSDSTNLNDYVINELHGAILRNRRITLVKPDQSQLQNISAVDASTARNIGQSLRVQYLITGSLQQSGDDYDIQFISINVSNTETRSHYIASLNPQNDDNFANLLGITPAPVTETARRQQEQQEERARLKQEREEQIARQQQEREEINARWSQLDRKERNALKTANVRNNWISAEGSLGVFNYSIAEVFNPTVVLSYERMFGSKLSLGLNLNAGLYRYKAGSVFGDSLGFSISAPFRFYPWGKSFFVGISIGWVFGGGEYGDVEYHGVKHSDVYIDWAYLIIAPGFGWKIDIGKPGGFFFRTGIELPLFDWYFYTLTGKHEFMFFRRREFAGGTGASLGLKVTAFLGIGWAF